MKDSDQGYVRFYRKTSKKGWYKKSEYVHLWIHILTKATHKGVEFFFNGTNIKLTPGQFFEKNEQQIEQQKTNKNRVISVLNWDLYQNTNNSKQHSEQQVNNKRTTSEQQVNTNNNDNNDNNNILSSSDSTFKEKFDKYIDYCNDHLKVNGARRNFRFSKSVFSKFKARIKEGYTGDDFAKAISKAKGMSHHKENGYQYLTPEFFTRTDTLEKYSS